MFLITLSGCRKYSKEISIGNPRFIDRELHYRIIIYKHFEIIEVYQIPLEEATVENVEYLNYKADSLILTLYRLDK